MPYHAILCASVLARVMVLARDMVLASVMVLAPVMVLACVMVLARVMVLAVSCPFGVGHTAWAPEGREGRSQEARRASS